MNWKWAYDEEPPETLIVMLSPHKWIDKTEPTKYAMGMKHHTKNGMTHKQYAHWMHENYGEWPVGYYWIEAKDFIFPKKYKYRSEPNE